MIYILFVRSVIDTDIELKTDHNQKKIFPGVNYPLMRGET